MTTPWRVLLIGGSSGTGKSTVAQAIGRQLAVSTLLVDDLRIALQAVTTGNEFPSLHTFISNSSPAYSTAAAFCQGLIAVADALSPALQVVIDHHLSVADAGPVIMEGDGVLPDLVAGIRDARCRAVFLHAADDGAILTNMQARGRGFSALPHENQGIIAEGNWLYGEELVRRARMVGLPVIEIVPFRSLPERILNAVGPAETQTPYTAKPHGRCA